MQKLQVSPGYSKSDGYCVAGLLQPPVSCSETRRILPSIHGLGKVNQFIVVPSFTMETLFSIITALQSREWITKIDLKDVYHTGLRQPLEILPPCSSRSNLSVPCPPVWAFDGSSGIHQDIGSCGPAVAHSGRPCPILTWTTELCVRILITESGTYTTNFSTSPVFGLNDQLKHVNVTTLTHSGLCGFKFQPGTSPYFSYGLFLTSSHQFPIPSPSTVMPAR